MHVALPKSELGQALLHADDSTDIESFRQFIDAQALETQLSRSLPAGSLKQLVDSDPDLAFLDEQGTRQRINRFCDLMTFNEGQLKRHLRHILMARQLILDADKRAFEEEMWLADRSEPAQQLSTAFALAEDEYRAQGTFYSYKLMATSSPEFGAPPVIVDGAVPLSQLDFLHTYAMHRALCTGWPKRRVEVLVVTGFKSVWQLSE